MELNKKIDGLKDELVASTRSILKIKSIEEPALEGMPYGPGVGKALECALDISSKLGFKTVNLDGYVGYAEYGEGEDYVGILGHLDVVPEGDGWNYPPYGAEIHDGRIYARGTLDDKGPIMAALYGLKAIKDLKLSLSKKVRIIFGTNEETGSNEIHHYLKKEKPPVSGFTPDAEYPIIYAEKGLTMFNLVKDLKTKPQGDILVKYIKGGQRPNMVPDYCEAMLEAINPSELANTVETISKDNNYKVRVELQNKQVIIKSYGVSAHGSMPELGFNAIMQLFELLEKLPIGESELLDFICFMNKNVGFDVYGERFGVGLEDKASGKLSFNVGVVNMDEKRISTMLNLRYPVTFKLEDMMNPFNARLEGTGIKVKDFVHQEPLYFPEDHSLIKTLQRVYTEQTGLEANLLAIGGGTYAKEMPNIVAFGPIFPGKPDLDHQANEYIEVADLVLNAKIYAHGIYELAK
ncbi:MAG: dipeptidase PepV [Clostridiales bacterium]|nr:dipeptidase PepV [Clostridiales bacterium]